MKSINITADGIIEYYGNKAGILRNNTAIVDEIFKKQDLYDYLTETGDVNVIWKPDIYNRLLTGNIEESVMSKRCRIYQLKPDTDVRMRFIGYNDLIQKGFGKPDISNYRVVYDGEISTNDLEEIYAQFNGTKLPDEYTGYSLSQSDIIELYDNTSNEMYYVDKIGFVRLDVKDENTEDIRPFDETKETVRESMPNPESRQETANTQQCEDTGKEPDRKEEFHVETFRFTM